MVYGALPPETRRQQARLFNEPGGGGPLCAEAGVRLAACVFVRHGLGCVHQASAPPSTHLSVHAPQLTLARVPAGPACCADNPYRVLVASDAVGMGLNLNIRRIIFHSVMKHEGAHSGRGPACRLLWGDAMLGLGGWEGLTGLALPQRHARAASSPSRAGGRERVPVSVSMLKQIAGRAGRRSSQWPAGLATCRDADDVPRLQEALDVRRGGRRGQGSPGLGRRLGSRCSGRAAGPPRPSDHLCVTSSCKIFTGRLDQKHSLHIIDGRERVPFPPALCRCRWRSCPPPPPACSQSTSTLRCLPGSAPTSRTGGAPRVYYCC